MTVGSLTSEFRERSTLFNRRHAADERPIASLALMR